MLANHWFALSRALFFVCPLTLSRKVANFKRSIQGRRVHFSTLCNACAPFKLLDVGADNSAQSLKPRPSLGGALMHQSVSAPELPQLPDWFPSQTLVLVVVLFFHRSQITSRTQHCSDHSFSSYTALIAGQQSRSSRTLWTTSHLS